MHHYCINGKYFGCILGVARVEKMILMQKKKKKKENHRDCVKTLAMLE